MENNSFTTYKNRGMLLERIINNTISHYLKNEIAFITKNSLSIKFQSITSSDGDKVLKLNNSFIKSKSTVDYYGLYKGQYISFEAKSTEEDSLPFSNIKPHQHQHLLLISKLGGKAFYIIFFKRHSRIFVLDVNDLNYENEKSISIEKISLVGKELNLIFPGIVDFLPFI